MQKYKRPKKYKGLRSIPLRNPRKVDMHVVFLSFERKIQKFYTSPSSGPSFVDPFLIKKLPAEPPPTFVILEENTYLEIRMYKQGKWFWLVNRNKRIGVEYKTRKYSEREEALYWYAAGPGWLPKLAGED